MPLELKNVDFNRCGTGVEGPHDLVVKAEDVTFNDTDRGFVFRDAPGLLARLGLPPHIPVADLIQALQILEGNVLKPPAERIEDLRESRLVKALGVGANLATIGPVLLSAQAQGLLTTAFQQMFG